MGAPVLINGSWYKVCVDQTLQRPAQSRPNLERELACALEQSLSLVPDQCQETEID